MQIFLSRLGVRRPLYRNARASAEKRYLHVCNHGFATLTHAMMDMRIALLQCNIAVHPHANGVAKTARCDAFCGPGGQAGAASGGVRTEREKADYAAG
jgi:hypothetical protein